MQAHPKATEGELPHLGAAIGPCVAMTHEEAIALYDAINRARGRIVRTISRARNLPAVDKAQALAILRADLAAFTTYAEALGEAHKLGGR